MIPRDCTRKEKFCSFSSESEGGKKNFLPQRTLCDEFMAHKVFVYCPFQLILGMTLTMAPGQFDVLDWKNSNFVTYM